MINIRNFIVTSLLVVLVTGCATSPAPRLYVLNSGAGALNLNSEIISKVVLVDLVLIPDYLDQKKIVMRAGPYRLERLEFDRWAEPLDLSIGAVIASTLRESNPGVRIVAYPRTASGPDVQKLQVRVERFEPTQGGKVVMEGTYELRQVNAEPSYVSFNHVEQMLGTSPEDAVAAMSKAVRALSLNIAQELQQK